VLAQRGAAAGAERLAREAVQATIGTDFLAEQAEALSGSAGVLTLPRASGGSRAGAREAMQRFEREKERARGSPRVERSLAAASGS
jgi:hypothetical protein